MAAFFDEFSHGDPAVAPNGARDGEGRLSGNAFVMYCECLAPRRGVRKVNDFRQLAKCGTLILLVGFRRIMQIGVPLI